MSFVRIIPTNQKALGNIRPIAQRIRSNGDTPTAEVSESLQDQIDQIIRILSSFAFTIPAAPNLTAGASVNISKSFLTANLTISSPSPTSEGQILLVFIQQDSTGGHLVSWSSIFRFPPEGLNRTKNTMSLAVFISLVDPNDGVLRWWTVALQTGKL